MPTGPRPTARPGAGPGRGRPRARNGNRSAKSTGTLANKDGRAGTVPSPSSAAPESATGSASIPEDAGSAPKPSGSASKPPGSGQKSPGSGQKSSGSAPQTSSPPTKKPPGRSSITTRAVALAVVILMLTISYANSLRIYFAQSHEVAATKVEIAEHQARIAELQTELERWNDPAFVKLQARTRLGWVVPGEIGFTVVDADGKPLGGGSELSTGAKPAGEETPESWYTRLWGSVEAADQPAPDPAPDPSQLKPITEDNVDDAGTGQSAPR